MKGPERVVTAPAMHRSGGLMHEGGNTRFHVSAMVGARDNAPTVSELDDGELVRMLTTPVAHVGDKLECLAWMPVRLRPDEQGRYRRAARYVDAVSCLVLDLDQGEPLKRAKTLIDGRRAILHTSWSHRPDFPKGRIVFPLAEPVPVAKWADVWTAAETWARGVELTIDPATKDASRLYFLPAYPRDDVERRRAFWARAWDGEYLSWRWLLAQYPRARQEVRTFAPVMSANVRGLPGQDRTELRRHFARRVIETRAEELATTPQGGRNLLAFRAGAAAAQLHAAGVLDLEEARAVLLSAALASGLSQREADAAIQNGMQRGVSDGPWQF